MQSIICCCHSHTGSTNRPDLTARTLHNCPGNPRDRRVGVFHHISTLTVFPLENKVSRSITLSISISFRSTTAMLSHIPHQLRDPHNLYLSKFRRPFLLLHAFVPLGWSLQTDSSPGRGFVLSPGVPIPDVIQRPSMPLLHCAHHPRMARVYNADATGGSLTLSCSLTRTKP